MSEQPTRNIATTRSRVRKEIGSSGTNARFGIYQDDFLRQLKGKNAIKAYTEMMLNDPIVGATLLAYENILRSSKWTLTEGDERVKELISRNFLKLPWLEVLGDVLTMLPFGWSFFEVVYELESTGTIGWNKWAFRPQATLEKWLVDDKNTVTHLVQRVQWETFEIPLSKGILFNAARSGGSPEGRSILRNAYRSWWFRKNFEEIEGVGVERDIVGIPVIKVPETISFADPVYSADKSWAEETLANLHQNQSTGVALGYGWELDLLTSPGKKMFDIGEIIGRYDKRIALSMLSQFLLLGLERIGSYGLAKTQTELFYDGLEGWALKIADAINRQAILRLVNLNFPDMEFADIPKLKPSRIRKIDMTAIGAFISAITKAELLPVDIGELQEQVVEHLSNELR